MTSVIINNDQWLTSGWWQDLQSKNKFQAFRESRKKAALLKKTQIDEENRENFNAVSIIQSESGIQAGFFELPEYDKNQSQRALASLFANKYDSCAIQLSFDSGVWVCFIDDGLVMPDTDYFGTPEDARSIYNDFFSIREWEKVIEIDIPGESVRLIEELLPDALPTPIRPLNKKLNKKQVIKTAIIAALILIFFVASFNYFTSFKEREEAEKAAAKARALKALQEQAYQKKIKQSQFKKIWENEPPVIEMAAYCFSEISRYPIVENGWELGSVSCDKIQITANWKRLDYGKLTILPQNASFDIKDSKATNSVSIVKKKPKLLKRPHEKLEKKESYGANLYQIALDYDFALSASWPPRATRTISAAKETKKPKVIVSPYQKCLWEITSRYKPQPLFFEKLSRIPGTVLLQITKDFKTDEWKIKGESYVE